MSGLNESLAIFYLVGSAERNDSAVMNELQLTLMYVWHRLEKSHRLITFGEPRARRSELEGWSKSTHKTMGNATMPDLSSPEFTIKICICLPLKCHRLVVDFATDGHTSPDVDANTHR